MLSPLSLKAALGTFEETWSPRIVAALNGQHVKLAKLEGAFVWHAHPEADELFLVLEGTLELHFRDRVESLQAGDLIVVPAGVEHKPVAMPTCSVLLFEPEGTKNTGDAPGERTADAIWIDRG